MAAAHDAVAAEVATGNLPPVGALANIAGITSPVPFLDTTLELWNKVMAVNATGTYLVTKAFLPDMIDNGWGRIVNMSSVSAQRGGGVFGKVPYSSAKAADPRIHQGPGPRDRRHRCHGQRRHPRRRRHQHPRRLHRRAGGQARRDIPIGRIATTEEIAAVITFLSSEDASYLTGTTVDINGGSHIH